MTATESRKCSANPRLRELAYGTSFHFADPITGRACGNEFVAGKTRDGDVQVFTRATDGDPVGHCHWFPSDRAVRPDHRALPASAVAPTQNEQSTGERNPVMPPINPTVFDDPPAELLAGAFGWNYESEGDPENPCRWRPRAWRIFYPDHMLTVDYRTHLCVRDTSIHPVR